MHRRLACIIARDDACITAMIDAERIREPALTARQLDAVALRARLVEQAADLVRIGRALDEGVVQVDARDALLRTRRHPELARHTALREDLDHAVDGLGAV